MIAVIKPSSLSLSNLNHNSINYDTFNSILDDSVLSLSPCSLKSNEITSDVVKYIDVNNNRVITSYLICEFPSFAIYSLYGLLPPDSEMEKIMYSRSIFGDYFTNPSDVAFGNVVLIKVNQHHNQNLPISKNDVVNVLLYKFLHTSMSLFIDGTFKPNTFFDTPFENVLKHQFIPHDSFDFLNTKIDLYFDATPSNNSINKPASSLTRKPYPIYGDTVLCISRYFKNDNYIIPVNTDYFLKILVIITRKGAINCSINDDDTFFFPLVDKYYNSISDKSPCFNVPNDIARNASINDLLKINVYHISD